jgi:hypothetical protein
VALLGAMEGAVQNCLRRTLQGARSASGPLLRIRAVADYSTHAPASATSIEYADSTLSSITISTSVPSRLPPNPANDGVCSAAIPSKEVRQVFVSGLFKASSQPLAARHMVLQQAAGSQSRGGFYQSWIAAGAFPFAVAAYSGVAVAKEKAPLTLPGEVVLYQYEACPFCNKVKGWFNPRCFLLIFGRGCH